MAHIALDFFVSEVKQHIGPHLAELPALPVWPGCAIVFPCIDDDKDCPEQKERPAEFFRDQHILFYVRRLLAITFPFYTIFLPLTTR